MKLIAVDVGNTSTAVGLWTDGRVGRVAHVDGGFGAAMDAVSRLCDGADGIAYVSVVPKADAKWRAFAEAKGLAMRQVSHGDFPLAPGGAASAGAMLRLDYPRPETIGADRLADAAGAVARYGAPVLVMDFGTALAAS